MDKIMIKFIELTSIIGRAMAINIDEIQGITEEDEGYTSISLKGDNEPYRAKETVSEILSKIYKFVDNINN